MNDLKQKTTSGLIYKFLERGLAKGIGFIISIILARILFPEEYGIISLVAIFITICDVFVVSGFSSALVVNKDSDEIDFSTCFYGNLAVSILLYILVFFTAPSVSNFYEQEILTNVIRVMGLRIPLAAINSIEQAYIQKHMQFKLFFYATLVGTLISGALSVVMAYAGFGVWALVEQNLGNMVIDTLVLWIVIKWRPKFVFSIDSFKKQFSFGWKVLCTGLIDALFAEIRGLVIGKKYSSEDLAYYNRGIQFSQLGMTIVEPTISGVLFPVLAKCNDDKKMMKAATRRSLKLSSFIIFPCMIGIVVCGTEIITVLLTEKWMPCLVYLEIGCIAYALRPMQVINNSLIKASGNGTLLLILDIIKKAIGIVLLIISIPMGVEAVAISFAITNLVSTLINIFPNKKLIDYGYLDQIKDILPSLVLSLIMGIGVYMVSLLPLKPIILLCLEVLSGMIIYFGLAFAFKDESLKYTINLLKSILKK